MKKTYSSTPTAIRTLCIHPQLKQMWGEPWTEFCSKLLKCCPFRVQRDAFEESHCSCTCISSSLPYLKTLLQKVKQTRSKGILQTVQKDLQSKTCSCGTFSFCKTKPKCGVVKNCGKVYRPICKGKKCKAHWKYRCKEVIDCFHERTCVPLLHNGKGGICWKKEEILRYSENVDRIRLLERSK